MPSTMLIFIATDPRRQMLPIAVSPRLEMREQMHSGCVQHYMASKYTARM